MLNGMVGRGCFSSPLKEEGERAMRLSAGGCSRQRKHLTERRWTGLMCPRNPKDGGGWRGVNKSKRGSGYVGPYRPWKAILALLWVRREALAGF